MPSDFVNDYALLLIKQYFSKPNARAEIETIAENFERPYNIMRQFPDALDVDLAIGDALDKVGKIVGVPRNVPLVIGKIAFGFDDNPTKARGFDDKFGPAISAPFYDKFTPPYTDQQLNDFDYRFIIKAKIAVNNTSAFIDSDERISIQDVIQRAFNGQAFVVDKKNMSLWLYITPAIDLDRLRLITALKLLPKPQGVRYDLIVQAAPALTFGFDDNPLALGFGDTFGNKTGYFANKVIL
jgi:hypothetical protein